jgi:hypothetical protein
VRSVDQDFDSLSVFFAEYTLVNLSENVECMACLKADKIYPPLLHVWSHCYLLATKKRLNLCDVKIAKDSRELVFLKECVWDIGSGFFCCFHGTNKPAHMALRSGRKFYAIYGRGVR